MSKKYCMVSGNFNNTLVIIESTGNWEQDKSLVRAMLRESWQNDNGDDPFIDILLEDIDIEEIEFVI